MGVPQVSCHHLVMGRLQHLLTLLLWTGQLQQEQRRHIKDKRMSGSRVLCVECVKHTMQSKGLTSVTGNEERKRSNLEVRAVPCYLPEDEDLQHEGV